MIVLGIETSTKVCSIGLAHESGRLGEKSLVESHIHSEKLLTLIQELCSEQHVELGQIEGIGVSIGPGSFTGLRIGLSSSQGLRYALASKLVPVQTFEGIAHAYANSNMKEHSFSILIDAKQGEYYSSAFRYTNTSLSEIHGVRIVSRSTLAAETMKRDIVLTDREEEVKGMVGQHIQVQGVHAYCRGDVIASLALDQLKNGRNADTVELEPSYLKDFLVRTQLPR